MKESELMEMSAVDLLNSFYKLAVRATKEVNTKRGLTKKTEREEQMVIRELSFRLGFEANDLLEKINQ